MKTWCWYVRRYGRCRSSTLSSASSVLNSQNVLKCSQKPFKRVGVKFTTCLQGKCLYLMMIIFGTRLAVEACTIRWGIIICIYCIYTYSHLFWLTAEDFVYGKLFWKKTVELVSVCHFDGHHSPDDRSAAPLTWNSLPPAVLNCDSLFTFKSRLKTHMLYTSWPCWRSRPSKRHLRSIWASTSRCAPAYATLDRRPSHCCACHFDGHHLPDDRSALSRLWLWTCCHVLC